MAVGFGVAVGATSAVGTGVGLGVGEGAGVGEGVGTGVGLGVGVGVAMAAGAAVGDVGLTVAPEPQAMQTMAAARISAYRSLIVDPFASDDRLRQVGTRGAVAIRK